MNTASRNGFILAAGGILFSGQIIAVREIGSTAFSTELAAAAASFLWLAGISLGRAASGVLDDRLRGFWGAFSLLLLASLPVSIRWSASLSSDAAAPFFSLFILLFIPISAGFLSAQLPRLSESTEKFKKLYALEALGAVCAILIFVLFPWRAALCVYWIALAALAAALWSRFAVSLAAASAAGLLIFFYPTLNARAAESFFSARRGVLNPRLVDSRMSRFQRIDIVDSESGRRLFLDGVLYFGEELSFLNDFLAKLPGSMLPRGQERNALVIGTGSFVSPSRLWSLGFKTTVVEIDAEAARSGFASFQGQHGLKKDAVQVIAQDGRRFLNAAPRESFNLIVLDLPAPYHLRTALLHTPEFYKAAAAALTPDGVAALCLSSGELGSPVALAVAASAAEAFGDIMIVSPRRAGLAFLYGAREKLPFTPEEIRAAAALGPDEILSDGEARRMLDSLDARPLKTRRLYAAFRLAARRIPFFQDD